MIRLTAVTILASLITFSTARADSTTPHLTLQSELAEDAATAHKIRNAGIGMLGAGLGSIALGSGLMVPGFYDHASPAWIITGTTLMSVGGAGLFAGIPTAVVGSWAEKQFRNPLLNVESANRKALRIRNAGIGLTVPGLAMALVGTTMFVVGAVDKDQMGRGGAVLITTGLGLLGPGLGITAIGIPLWATGQWASNRFQHLKTPVQVSFSAAPTRDGASAQLNFTF